MRLLVKAYQLALIEDSLVCFSCLLSRLDTRISSLFDNSSTNLLLVLIKMNCTLALCKLSFSFSLSHFMLHVLLDLNPSALNVVLISQVDKFNDLN